MVPAGIKEWLDGWGSGLQRAIESGLTAASSRFGVQSTKLPQRLLVGTDCSGLDAPIHGLRELRIPHQHLFGSEVAAGPRSVIEANTKPSEALFHSVLDADKAPFVHLYIAGFSCKPFSLLHNKTKLLEEDQARIFYAVVARIRKVRPACFVLENVTGIKRVSSQVLSILRSTGYQVEMILMNPAELQEPVQRPRYYFIAVRQDVSVISSKNLLPWLSAAWASVKEAAAPARAVSLSERLLPVSHPAVAHYQEARKRKWLKAFKAGFPACQGGNTKWQELRKKCRASMRPSHRLRAKGPQTSVPCSADTLFLHLPREREAWDILCRQHECSEELAADLSQNVTRSGARNDGSLPTITPGALLAAAGARRIIAPLEKILLHAFPIHRMVFPANLTDKELASMGGNTMHVEIVAVAMMLALALVDWTKPDASRPNACPAPESATRRALPAARGSKKPRQRRKAERAPRFPGRQTAQAHDISSALARRWQRAVAPPRHQPEKQRSRRGAKKRHQPAPSDDLISRLARRWSIYRSFRAKSKNS